MIPNIHTIELLQETLANPEKQLNETPWESPVFQQCLCKLFYNILCFLTTPTMAPLTTMAIQSFHYCYFLLFRRCCSSCQPITLTLFLNYMEFSNINPFYIILQFPLQIFLSLKNNPFLLSNLLLFNTSKPFLFR